MVLFGSTVTKGGGGAICHVQSGPMAYGALHYYIWRNGELGRPTLDQALSSTILSTDPFQAPAILDTIAEAFFVDDASVGVKFHEKLVSTVEDRPDERELPVAMVALAGTAVRSVIMQYSSEKYDRDFNCELYSGIYKTLVGILNGIFDTSERKYHVLMNSVYKTVYGSKANVVCDLETDEALMFLDIDAMPESEEYVVGDER
ncbi:uncharacterized protein HD556DRAFT_1302656 [Suillus plorans]|uniref:DUF6532 domain-containing protein n=1 Tax=Suillus plorans TaxID=116603 RepID=A0A9P7E4D4_9AGAM|nr:uncharacterized protein HD556DRAFT_1302656 [Suillus plorans]KAG1810330.1 hypothetical protein HD556DRAFT_1302656 [Suillus plorans]